MKYAIKIADIFEKIVGSIVLIVSFFPIGFPILSPLYSVWGHYNYLNYLLVFLLGASFFALSIFLSKYVDMGEMKRGRRMRKFLYLVIAFIPILILFMKAIYPQGNFHMGF